MISFADALASDAAWIASRLDKAIRSHPAGPVRDAMAYAAGGGKRVRGFLVLESARLHGMRAEAALDAAAAVEAMHAYSLVHDDLPSMDNDDMRRGKPTVHKAWNEATAVLTGDALQALAFGLLAGMEAGADARVRLVAELADAAGAGGMVYGQALDIAAGTAGTPFDLAAVERLQTAKTGALIRWSARVGPRLAGADPSALTAYAEALGRAFQIADDFLDTEGDPETVGKAVGKDAGAGKATFVSLLGADGARRKARQLVEDAVNALTPYGDAASTLAEAARFAISRRR